MRFDIEIDDRQAVRALAELRRRGESMEPALRSIGELLLNSTRAQPRLPRLHLEAGVHHAVRDRAEANGEAADAE